MFPATTKNCAIVERKRDLFKPVSDIQKALGRVAIMADTAHAFGAKLGDKMIGSVADFSSFFLPRSEEPDHC